MNPVFLTPDEITELRLLISSGAEADLAEAIIGAPARAVLGEPDVLPPPVNGKAGNYWDFETGEPLIFDRRQMHQHRSPSGRVFEGDPYETFWCELTHNALANDVRTCALAAVLLDDVASGERAAGILRNYAAAYRDYPVGGSAPYSWGRLFDRALREAIWSISMLWGTDLLYQGGYLDDDDVAALQRGLFEPIVDLLWGEWYFAHNIRMWHSAAIGSIGLAFDDRLATRHAIFGSMGYRQLAVDGFRADGYYVEGSTGYHSFGLAGMMILAEAMARNGFTPYQDGLLRKVALCPIRMLQPDLTIPALNDYRPGIPLPTRLYGTLLRRHQDDDVRQAAALAYREWRDFGFGCDPTGSGWNNTTAYYARQQVDWLFVLKELEIDSPYQPEPLVDLRASGIGIVRPAPKSYVLLKCSPQGGSGGHDHYDRLALQWWHNGLQWLGDPGTLTYSHPMHEGYFKQTISHNSILADGLSQERYVSGKLLICKPTRVAGSVAPYPENLPDVSFCRETQIEANSLQDLMIADGATPHTFDYILHPRGELQAVSHSLEGTLDIPYLTEERRTPHRQLVWVQDQHQLTVDLSALPEEAEIWLAKACPDATRPDHLEDMLVIRLRGSHCEFRVTLTVD